MTTTATTINGSLSSTSRLWTPHLNYDTDSGEQYYLDQFQSDSMKDRNAGSKSKSIFEPTVAGLSYVTNWGHLRENFHKVYCNNSVLCNV